MLHIFVQAAEKMQPSSQRRNSRMPILIHFCGMQSRLSVQPVRQDETNSRKINGKSDVGKSIFHHPCKLRSKAAGSSNPRTERWADGQLIWITKLAGSSRKREKDCARAREGRKARAGIWNSNFRATLIPLIKSATRGEKLDWSSRISIL